MATIKQIAELAGVSRGTVDRVLNNRGSVNANTAARVREIAEKLNYKPNKAGLMLAAQKKNLKIGVILFPDSNPFFSEVLEGVNAKAKELSAYNFTVLIRQVPFDETEQFNTMEALLAEGINGLVIAPFNSLYIAAEIDRLTEMNIPVITVNTDILSRRIAYVGSNYRLSGQTAAGLVSLMTFGEIHIGIVTGSSHVLCHSDRIEGFTSTLSEKGERIHIVETIENHDDDNESYEKVKEMLASHLEINVLYFAAGGVAGGCRAAVESGRIDAMRIFTYDCVPSTKKLLDDGIITATICQQPYKQGYLPVELLSRYLIEGISCEEFHYTDIDIRIKENL